MMVLIRVTIAIGISIAALLISFALDLFLAPLPLPLQFIVQVPALVILMDELRLWLVRHLPTIRESTINGTFFLAAPIAAFGARNLFNDVGRFIYGE